MRRLLALWCALALPKTQWTVTMRCLFAAFLVLATPVTVWAGASQPPALHINADNPELPDARTNLGVGSVARGHRRVWRPFDNNPTIDTGGTTFFPSSSTKTAYLAVEIEDDAAAVKVSFQNTGTSSYTITNAAVAGSSQLAAPGYTTVGFSAAPGITAYDGSGTAATLLCGSTATALCWNTLTFGNGGADSTSLPGVLPLNAPSNAIAVATSGSSTGTTLNFGATSPAALIGMKLVIPATTGTYPALPSEATYVTAAPAGGCAGTVSCTVTIGPAGLKNTVPSGTTVYFLPLTMVVPAATAPPVPTIVQSDWASVQTFARRDGYPLNGMSLSGPAGLAPATTVSGTPAAGSISLSTPTLGAIPKGTVFAACQSLTTNATLTPNYTGGFTDTSGIVSGMQVVIGGIVSELGGSGGAWENGQVRTSAQGGYHTTVASLVTNTSVTFADPMPEHYGSFTSSTGASTTSFQFTLPLTLAAPAASGQNIVFVAPGLSIATGLKVIGSNITPSTTTVSAYNSGTGELDLSANLTGALNQGDPIAVSVSKTNTSTITSATAPSFASVTDEQWYLDGAYISAANFPARDYIWNATSTSLSVLWSPTATIASGTALNVCRDWTTSAALPAGSTSLTVNPPKRLLLVRVNIGSANANYLTPALESMALQTGSFGMPHWDAGTCAAGTDGVLSPSSITNSSGGCNRGRTVIPYAIETWSPRRGATIAMLNGDSHFTAYDARNAGLANRLAAHYSSPSLPVSGAQIAWGGKDSAVFEEPAKAFLSAYKPEIVLLGGWTWNDSWDQRSLAHFIAKTEGMIDQVMSAGGIPVVVTEYPRRIFGCTPSGWNATGETIRQQALAYWQAVTASGALVFDLGAALDPSNTGYIDSRYSDDCIHANDAGIAAALPGLESTLDRYIGAN